MLADLLPLFSAVKDVCLYMSWPLNTVPQSHEQHGSEGGHRFVALHCGTRYPKDTGIDRTPSIGIWQPSVICRLILHPLFIYPPLI